MPSLTLCLADGETLFSVFHVHQAGLRRKPLIDIRLQAGQVLIAYMKGKRS